MDYCTLSVLDNFYLLFFIKKKRGLPMQFGITEIVNLKQNYVVGLLPADLY